MSFLCDWSIHPDRSSPQSQKKTERKGGGGRKKKIDQRLFNMSLWFIFLHLQRESGTHGCHNLGPQKQNHTAGVKYGN